MLKRIVELIVRELVENSSSVRVEQKKEDKKITFMIHVEEKDFGKVIGKGGETIRAIRSLITVLNSDKNSQIVIDVAK